VKLFIRTDKETINNALQKSLPEFLHIYKDVTSEKILKEAYHSLRGSTTQEFTSTNLDLKVDKKEETIVSTNVSDLVPDNLSEVSVSLKKEKVIEPQKKVSKEIKKENKVTSNKVLEKSKDTVKFNKKEVLTTHFNNGLTAIEAVAKILETDGIVIDKYYANEVYKKLKL